MANSKDKVSVIPKHSIDSIARCLLPEMQRYFNSEEGKREFEKWKAEHAKAGKESK